MEQQAPRTNEPIRERERLSRQPEEVEAVMRIHSLFPVIRGEGWGEGLAQGPRRFAVCSQAEASFDVGDEIPPWPEIGVRLLRPAGC